MTLVNVYTPNEDNPAFFRNVVEGTNVITGHKCNKANVIKCSNIWSQM